MADDDRILELVEEVLDSGLTPEEVCARDPELLEEVRACLKECQGVKLMVRHFFPVTDLPETPPLPPGLHDSFPNIPGYEVLEVLGRGGNGIIYRVRHTNLDRVVALKMLLSGEFASPIELARFTREAEAIAALQHPNIVQIYDVGEVEGRPYFTMEFVCGGSLAKKLASTPQPAKYCAALTETIARAIHAGHLAGIVHRDVKPGNILLAADGTPKVTDFGLARPLEQGPEVTLGPAKIGTPSYMAPEQVVSKPGTVGPPADVYSLGATLYELLTGRPPFRAESAAETERQVLTQEPAAPSKLNAKVPRDLETICLKCLQKEPARRYESAEALADDLKRFSEGRPIQARPVGWTERSWRWCRRNPMAAGFLLTTIALVGLASGGATWLLQQRARHNAELRTDVGTAVTQAASLREGYHFNEARALLEHARQHLGSAGYDELRKQVNQAQADLGLVERLDSARNRGATVVAGEFDPSRAQEPLYLSAFADAGLGQEGQDAKAAAAKVRGSEVRAELVDALDHWAGVTRDQTRRAWLLAVAREADPNPTRNRLRQPELWQDAARLTRAAQELPAAELTPQLMATVGRFALERNVDAMPLMTIALARSPKDFWLNHDIAVTLHEASRNDEALGYFRAAMVLRPDCSESHNGLGVVLYQLGRFDEALSEYQEAIRLDPNFALPHEGVAGTLRNKGRNDEAISQFQLAIKLGRESGFAYNGLAKALNKAGRHDEAINYFEKALRSDPKNVDAQINFGNTLCDMGRMDEGIQHLRQAVRIEPEWVSANNDLGMALNKKGQHDEAINYFEKALRSDPNNAYVYTVRINLGRALCDMGRFDEGIQHLQQAVRIRPDDAGVHISVGWELNRIGRVDEAIRQYQEALDIDPKSARAHDFLANALFDKGRIDEGIEHLQQALRIKPDDADTRTSLGVALRRIGRVDEAISQYQAALDIDPKYALAHGNLAQALFDKGRIDEGISQYQQAIQINPTFATYHLNLGLALRDKGHLDEGIEQLQQALRIEPESALIQTWLGYVLYSAAGTDIGAAAQSSAKPQRVATERSEKRRRALDRLRTSLELSIKLMNANKPVTRSLDSWQTDPALASVRDPAALAALPDSEREQWSRLWADVASAVAADPRLQGEQYAAHRDWAKAVDSYARSLARGPMDDGHFWYEYAALLLLSGDRSGYTKACSHTVKACGKPGGPRGYHVARACTLAPDAVADPSLPGRLANKELQDNGKQFWSLTEQGAMAYRAGRLEESASFFEQSLRADSHPGRAVVNWVWLALANQRLGKTDEAHRWLEKAQKWLDQYRDGVPPDAEAKTGLHLHNWLEANVLRREAETLLSSK
jgi:serine/threonine-protein kinase